MRRAKRQQIRQGDVWLRPIATKKTPTGSRVPLDLGRVVLAYGEVTGHAHCVVEAEPTTTPEMPAAHLFDEPDGTRMLLVDRPCHLVHEEHGTITLAPGAYRVVRQREYSPEAVRQVAD